MAIIDKTSWARPILLCALGVFAATAHGDVHTTCDAFAAAVSSAPAVAAAKLRLLAAQSRLESAGRIADPQLTGMYATRQTPEDDIPMWEVTLEQPFPKAGERKADRRRATAAADMLHAELTLAAGEVAAETATRLAEAETAHRREILILSQLARLEGALAAVTARVGTGQSASAERLALTTRVADLRLMAARDALMARDAESAARAQLGLPHDAPLPPYDAPAVADILAAQSPAVHLAQARAREAAAMAAMANAGRYPMTAIGLRFEREAMPDGDEDTVGIALMTEIPWRSRGYARADYRAAEAERAASGADETAVQHAVAALLEQVERAATLAATARELAANSESRLAAEYDALVSSAGTAGMASAMPVLMLIEIQDRSTDLQVQVVELEGAERAARAALWRHAPASRFATLGDAP